MFLVEIMVSVIFEGLIIGFGGLVRWAFARLTGRKRSVDHYMDQGGVNFMVSIITLAVIITIIVKL